MKLTKGMKKALSLLLSAAMVVTGVNVTTNTASAETQETSIAKWTGSIMAAVTDDCEGVEKNSTWQGETTTNTFEDVFGEDSSNVWAGGAVGGWCGANFTATVDLSTYESVKLIVSGTSSKSVSSGVEVCFETNAEGGWVGSEVKAITAEDGAFVLEENVPAEAEFVALAPKNANVTITSIELVEVKEVVPTEEPTEEPTETPVVTENPTTPDDVTPDDVTPDDVTPDDVEPTEAPTEAPAEPKADQDQAFLMFTDGSWGWGNWNTKVTGGWGHDATITGNGDYEVSIDADCLAEANKDTEGFELTAADGATVFCVDMINLCNSPNMDISEMEVSNVKIYADNKSIPVNTSKIKMGQIEGETGNFRMEIFNQYGSTVEDPAIDNEALTFKSSLKVAFTLSGIKDGVSENAFSCDSDGDGQNDTFASVKDAKDEWSEAGEADPNPIETEVSKNEGGEGTPAPEGTASAAPQGTASAAPTTPATGGATSGPAVTTGSSIATKTAVSGAAATSKIKVAKSKVVIAPGKSTKVKFSVSVPAAASKAAVVKVTTKSKKVATAKISGKKVKISVPKKAVKGASTTITLKSTKLNGKACSATIKVFVQNKAKKIVAAKKSITIKKGKKAKLTIKVKKAENKKKAVTDTVKVTSKVAKLVSTKASKGKIVLTLKGKKKGSQKATIKVGSKKVKVNVKVK